jgi:sugar phosphate isomerase/epimerase
MSMCRLSRRRFLAHAAAAAGAGVMAARPLHAQDSLAWKVGGFTKPLQDLSFEETARVAGEIGWDGIELALRADGHVLPERVEDDLPRMVSALGARGQRVLVIATDVRRVDPLSERVLRAAARAGIRLYRTSWYRYRDGISIPRQLDEIRAQLKDLAALNAEIGVTGLMQNHSGNGYVGAAVWDLYSLLEHIDPRQIGVHFDIGHATVEGGLSWPTQFALVQDRIGAVIVKDFVWRRTPGRGGQPDWCPLGQGMVDPRFFARLRTSGFQGPITMQCEYQFEAETVEARVRALKADNTQLRAWLATSQT